MSKEALLNRITSPHQLRRMSMDELAGLAEEVRQRIIEVVSNRGGHLASNLGMTELTIAMHYVFDFASDRLLWDVGHQCYAHKLITGRGEKFDSLRQKDGLSGFPSPAESEYDLFATGHAGTAISTAAGLAWADQQAGRDEVKTVALVGDASIVNGLSLEGLNNASLLKRQFLIVLNDNSMAIDRTHGALANALDNIRMTHTYGDIKNSTERMLQKLPLGTEISDTLRHVRGVLRSTIHGAKVFETLGLNYFGPIDGHDIPSLIRVLQRLAKMNQPTVLHVYTQKGRGCAYAVEDPCRFHSPSAYTIRDGQAVFPEPARPTWTNIFAEKLIELAKRDERIVAITAAMPDGTGLAKFREVFPHRTIDVGISESHAVAMAAGMARAGLRPVVAIYSTFMQRAFDQVFHEVALQKLPVVFCMDRAGLVGSDGAVHHGFADIAMMRMLPGVAALAPADAEEMAGALEFAFAGDGPVAIRYPRDEVPPELPGTCPPFEMGQARLLRQGCDATLLAYGAMVEPTLRAAEMLAEAGLEAAVVNARFAKPLDAATISRLLRTGKPMLVIEDHAKIGGLGSAVLELAADRGLLSTADVHLLGIPDRFVQFASRHEQLKEVGLNAATIAETTKSIVRQAVEKEREHELHK